MKNQKELTLRLSNTLEKLESVYQGILKTQGYTREAAKIKILTELVKEQTKHENTDHTTR